MTVHYCEQHEGEVTRLAARLVRWISNLLWGVRFETLRPALPATFPWAPPHAERDRLHSGGR